ncbi:alpha/beta fold hydrolase [Baekduia soli]|uniref:Alpha/beta fold hydrolase n=1 Tax=Baekduia soli TaxID=496014 RepID=A0A5B8U815_9ACTN|nr:alpha/beta fold hydrolase [Baekduia soli]QEC49091.1 alpha/beta fold hydrolase [Baekduia soli]
MAHITVSGRELFHQRRGHGEPLLLVQGMSGTHLTWGEPFLEALAGHGFDVISYDHRGVGRSARVDDPFSIADLAADAAGLLDALGLEAAHVLGVSMGGMVAQELALGHPDRVRTLALGCTYCGGPGSVLVGDAVLARLSASMLSGDRERSIRAMFDVNVSAAFAARPGAYEAFRAMAKSLPAPVPVVMLQMQAIFGHDTSARLPGLRVPTLVVHGDEDIMLPVANGRLIAGLIPGARYEELPGVGHLFWWEQPQRSAELVAEGAAAGAPGRTGAGG